jgi:hypothetical protein
MRIKSCPFCGEKPEIETIGSHIEIWCCVSKSAQKSDYMSYDERMENDFSRETHMYPDHIEQMVLEQVLSEWNTRFIDSHKGFLADLRNKYGRINTYFQLKKACENPNVSDGVKTLFVNSEQTVMDVSDKFVELLKTDNDVWESQNDET